MKQRHRFQFVYCIKDFCQAVRHFILVSYSDTCNFKLEVRYENGILQLSFVLKIFVCKLFLVRCQPLRNKHGEFSNFVTPANFKQATLKSLFDNCKIYNSLKFPVSKFQHLSHRAIKYSRKTFITILCLQNNLLVNVLFFII